MASALRRAIAGITREEAARILAVHQGTVDRLIRRGVLAPGRKYATAQLSWEQVKHRALTTRPVRRLVAGDYGLTRSGAATSTATGGVCTVASRSRWSATPGGNGGTRSGQSPDCAGRGLTAAAVLLAEPLRCRRCARRRMSRSTVATWTARMGAASSRVMASASRPVVTPAKIAPSVPLHPLHLTDHQAPRPRCCGADVDDRPSGVR